ncbi:MAG: translation initiation factor [Muribaculaceae bacterium]|nr:translation initiation factor [Muribaculaceae bacterium]
MNSLEDAMKRFLEANPDLPAGEETQAEAETDTKATSRQLRVSIERKGRAGKTATIIEGFTPDDDIASIASMLKTRLGTGGSARGCEILIQGDRRADAADILRSLGHKVKGI